MHQHGTAQRRDRACQGTRENPAGHPALPGHGAHQKSMTGFLKGLAFEKPTNSVLINMNISTAHFTAAF